MMGLGQLRRLVCLVRGHAWAPFFDCAGCTRCAKVKWRIEP